jgi:hypothetical protein
MIKKIATTVLLIGGCVILLWTIPAHRAARRSERLWHDFQVALLRKDMATVRQLLADADNDLHEISGDRILYCGDDFTEKFVNDPAMHWKTMEYYLTEGYNVPDKVILAEGYAEINNGRITFLKLP